MASAVRALGRGMGGAYAGLLWPFRCSCTPAALSGLVLPGWAKEGLACNLTLLHVAGCLLQAADTWP